MAKACFNDEDWLQVFDLKHFIPVNKAVPFPFTLFEDPEKAIYIVVFITIF